MQFYNALSSELELKVQLIYVTHFPCLNCTKSIIQAGIKEICYANDYRNNEYARELLEKSGVVVRKVDYDVNNVVERLLNK